jgi:hypothetical protein
VAQKLTSIRVTPATATVKARGTQQFVATAYDQFNNALSVQPAFTWSRSGRGSITSQGLFTAPRTLGTYTITASGGGVKGTATVTVVA